MTTLVERLAELKRAGDYAALVETIPYARWLGISIDGSSGELRGKLEYSDMLVGNPALPALHGGTLGALLESTAIFQLIWEQDTVVLPKTINITIQYLRSARPVTTWARGQITKQGRRVCNVRIEAWQEDRARPVALADAHFLVAPLGEG